MCKKSAKSVQPFLRFLPDGRTDERTDKSEFIGHPVSRGSKNGDILSSVAEGSLRVLLALQDELLLNQYIFDPTRGLNVLDLFFTSNPFLVTNVDCKDTNLSDHRLISITVSSKFSNNNFKTLNKSCREDPFGSLDLNKADFDLLNDKLSQVEWNNIFSDLPLEEIPEMFSLLLLQVCEEYIPKKQKKTGRPKVMHASRRK